eukprot:TRINITY_DN68686_c0_g1_i1.p1 TRINITY_DN68686_c0_g1~~TRINITY_DN68686_c0_g1_i1.p1  ORF type:complete len:217 (-),score=34.30 TRINITY_DN68686_c0_g1_i1:246-896(-)
MEDDDVCELLFKVLVIGDIGVGKTSFIKRYVHGLYTPNYRVTIGVDFGLKELYIGRSVVRVQLWDIAGQERFGNLTRVYYKEAVGALVVFDLTSRESLTLAGQWKADVDRKVFLPSGERIPCLLIANKCDLPAAVTTAEVDSFCRQHGFIGWYRCSAKDGTHVDDSCLHLVNHILAADPQRLGDGDGTGAAGEPSTVALGDPTKIPTVRTRKKCAC